MADYWKSQPRHFCDFCKCWIADNKPSKEFHEKGKKHLQNVKLKISEVRKKGFADALKKEEMADSLREMEEAAIRALKEDLTKDPSMANAYGVKIKKKEQPMFGPANKPDDDEAEAPPGDSESEWQEAWTPEGYVYYWNAKGERTWEKPEGYMPSWERARMVEKAVEDHLAGKADDTQSDDSDHSQKKEEQTDSGDEGQSEDQGHVEEKEAKDSKDKTAAPTQGTSVMMPSLHDIPLPPLPGAVPSKEVSAPETVDLASDLPPAKVPKLDDTVDKANNYSKGPKPVTQGWAYGAWESVKTEQPPPVDLQLPNPVDPAQSAEDPPPAIPEVIEEPKMKFRQKKVDTLGQELVAFKKRKMNARLQQGLRKKDTDR